MAFYPKKETVVVLVISVAAVCGAAFYVFRSGKANDSLKPSAQVLSISPDISTASGNADWKSQFSEAGAIAGSGTASPQQKAEPLPKNITSTYRFGQNFLTQYMTLKQMGLENDDPTVSAAMSQAVQDSSDSIPAPKMYSASDINIIADSSTSLSAYSKVLQTTYMAYSSRPDEAKLAVKAFDDQDFGELAALDESIAAYSSILRMLQSAAVPKSAASAHVMLLNGISGLLFSAESFRHVDTDPVRTLATIKLDVLATQNADTAFAALINDRSISMQ